MLQRERFKQSTRALLSQEQKTEIIRAVNRASDRLAKLDYKEGPLKQRLVIFYRLMMLLKGATPARYFYRFVRQAEIWQRACDIAEETGDPEIDVYRSIINILSPYVSEEP